jgi:hypothetical protein
MVKTRPVEFFKQKYSIGGLIDGIETQLEVSIENVRLRCDDARYSSNILAITRETN